MTWFKRSLPLVALVALLAFMGGCAAYNYPKYADAKKDVVVARETSRHQVATGLTAAASNGSEAQKAQATTALLVMALTEKADGLEAPKEGALERGIERLLDLGGLALVVDRLGARIQAPAANTKDSHDVNNSNNQDRHDSVTSTPGQ